jgi:hypothetical protein
VEYQTLHVHTTGTYVPLLYNCPGWACQNEPERCDSTLASNANVRLASVLQRVIVDVCDATMLKLKTDKVPTLACDLKDRVFCLQQQRPRNVHVQAALLAESRQVVVEQRQSDLFWITPHEIR